MSDCLTDWIAQLFQHREMLLMGHAQRQADSNLGLGWLYYSLTRIIRPSKAVVIGSYRGFVPLVIARAMADNSEGGVVHFIDPSLVDNFWTIESGVQSYFASHGVTNIRHWLMTTQKFVATEIYRQLDQIGIVFVDGYHSAEQACFDFEAFANKLMPSGMVLLHDSVWRKKSTMYGPGREYEHSVVDFLAQLKHQNEWQLLDLPFGDGVSIVRRAAMPGAASPTPAHCEAGRMQRGSLAVTGGSSIRHAQTAITQEPHG